MTIQRSTVTAVHIPHKRNPLISYISENKTPLLLGLTVGLLISAPVFVTSGAAIYHLITDAALANCSSLQNTVSWKWETTTLQ